MSGTGPLPVASNNLVLRTINAEIEQFVDLDDVITGLSGISIGGGVLPESYITTIPMGDMEGQKVQRLLMTLEEDGGVGDLSLAENSGEFPREKSLTDYVSVYYKVLNRKSPEMTIGGHLMGKAFFNMSRQLLPQWVSVQRGIYFRQAAIERVPYPLLTTSPWNLTTGWNTNQYVSTVAAMLQPVYDSDPTVFEANMKAAFAAASFATSDAIVADTFITLKRIADINWRMVRPGGPYGGSLAVLVGPYTQDLLQRYSTTGSLVSIRRTTLDQSIAKTAYLRTLGEFQGFELICDSRAPIGVYDTGTNEFTVIYRGHSTIDERLLYHTTDTQKVFEACIVLGKGGLRNPVARKASYHIQEKDFGRLNQVMALAIEGFGVPVFDDPVAADQNDLSMINQGIGLLWVPVPAGM